jgi:hypothetical protein
MRREIKLMSVEKQNNPGPKGGSEGMFSMDATWDEKEALKILQMQREQIDAFRLQIGAASEQLSTLRTGVQM